MRETKNNKKKKWNEQKRSPSVPVNQTMNRERFMEYFLLIFFFSTEGIQFSTMAFWPCLLLFRLYFVRRIFQFMVSICCLNDGYCDLCLFMMESVNSIFTAHCMCSGAGSCNMLLSNSYGYEIQKFIIPNASYTFFSLLALFDLGDIYSSAKCNYYSIVMKIRSSCLMS